MELKKYKVQNPFFALAPMANITTYPFASQCTFYGADLVWTPMVHTDTIINNWQEAEKILNFENPFCHFDRAKRPEKSLKQAKRDSSTVLGMTGIGIKNYVVQIIGSEPDNVAQSIKIIDKNLKPLGIDLNFACPDKNIVKSGCGGYLMQDPDKIIEIVKSAKSATNLPISVKTRAGWDNLRDIFNLAERLEKAGVDMIIVHPRTVRSGFKGEADWEVVKELIKKLPNIPIVGSGNITDWQDAISKQSDTNCAGVMIGRKALGKPWIFKEIREGKLHNASLPEIKKLSIDLAEKADKIWGEKGITESKKHFAWYFRGFPEAKEFRKKLMDVKSLAEVKNILH